MLKLDWMKKHNITKEILIISIIFMFSFFGGNFFGFNLGGLTFSYYRIILLATFATFFFLKKFNFKKSTSHLFVKCFGVWLIMSAVQLVIVKDLGSALKIGLVLVGVLCLFLLAIEYISSYSALKTVLYALLVGISLLLLFGLFEMLTGIYFNLEGAENLAYYESAKNFLGLHIPIGFSGNPNDFGVICLSATLIIHLFLSLSNSKKEKAIGYIILGLNLFVWVGTNSRTAFLTIAVFYAIFFLFKFKKKIFNIGFLSSAGLAAVVALVFVFSIDLTTQGSDSTRLNLIFNGFDILFKNSWGFGVGLGQIEWYMASYTNTDGITNIHNFIMELFVSGGIIAFAALVLCYVSGAKQLYLNAYDEEKTATAQNLSKSCGSFLVAFIVASIASSSLIDSEYMWATFVLVVVVANVIKVERVKI